MIRNAGLSQRASAKGHNKDQADRAVLRSLDLRRTRDLDEVRCQEVPPLTARPEMSRAAWSRAALRG